VVLMLPAVAEKPRTNAANQNQALASFQVQR